MNPKLFASLLKVIEDWSGEHCEDVDWPAVQWTVNLDERITRAAEIVFDTAVETTAEAEANA